MGTRSSRRSPRTWLPALPPKMPYSCCKHATSTVLTFRKSAARRYESTSLSAISKRTRGGYACRLPGSFIARTKQSSSENSRERASLKSVVKVAMPHWRGAWLPSIAIVRQIPVDIGLALSVGGSISGPCGRNPGGGRALLDDRGQCFHELRLAEAPGH